MCSRGFAGGRGGCGATYVDRTRRQHAAQNRVVRGGSDATVTRATVPRAWHSSQTPSGSSAGRRTDGSDDVPKTALARGRRGLFGSGLRMTISRSRAARYRR
jgi:hypothetical protein